jgi:hypothetical protein
MTLKFMNKKYFTNVIMSLFFLPMSPTVFAAAIKIAVVSNLNFGTMIQGDGSKLIPPGTVENAANASFSVTGNNNTAYTIILPTSTNLTKAGGANILVNQFVSFPPAGANGLLSSTGKQTLLVGATIAGIPVTQVRGAYSGTFTMTVVY